MGHIYKIIYTFELVVNVCSSISSCSSPFSKFLQNLKQYKNPCSIKSVRCMINSSIENNSSAIKSVRCMINSSIANNSSAINGVQEQCL